MAVDQKTLVDGFAEGESMESVRGESGSAVGESGEDVDGSDAVGSVDGSAETADDEGNHSASGTTGDDPDEAQPGIVGEPVRSLDDSDDATGDAREGEPGEREGEPASEDTGENAGEDETENAGDPEPADEALQNGGASQPDASAGGAKPENRNTTSSAPLTTAGSMTTAAVATGALQESGVQMHRLYNPYTGEHFYTANTAEKNHLVPLGWRYEGIGWIAPSSGNSVFRLYNPYAGDHHYTLNASERDYLVKVGWRYEGVGWYSGGSYKVYRQYNPYARSGTHNFTSNVKENNYLASIGWRAEGVGWYALADTPQTIAAVIASLPTARAVLYVDNKPLVVNSYTSGSTYYLFLPTSANLAALHLSAIHKGSETNIMVANSGSKSFITVQLGGTVNVKTLSTVTDSNGAKLLWFRTPNSGTIQRLAIMSSSQIGSLHIASVNASQGRRWVEASADHSATANVIITMIGANGTVIYNKDTAASPGTIKGRGNNTWGLGVKKPYQISLNKKADLLQTGNSDNAQKKWVLLSDCNDVTMLHNTIAYNLALEMGMIGTECIPVDVYYDGEYRGTYLLCEKIQLKDGRIGGVTALEDAISDANPNLDLSKLPVASATNAYGKPFQYVKGAIVNPADISGGYLLEIDGAYYRNEKCWFQSSLGIIVVKSPDYCSYEIMKYISEYFEKAARALINGDNSYFDIESLSKSYILNEYAKNIDAFFSSTYFYKGAAGDADGARFFAQPVWDFDASMGTRTDTGDTSFLTYEGFVVPSTRIATPQIPKPVAWIPAVQARARELWTSTLKPLVTNILLSSNANAVGARGYLHSLVYYRNQVAASQRMNQIVFGLTSFRNEIKPFGTYAQNVDYLKNWLTWRAAWITDNLDRLTGTVVNPSWSYGGKDYGLVFDTRYYRAVNAKLVGANASDAAVIQHFVNYGMAHGLVASRNFNVTVYKNRYADLRAAFGNNLTLYYLHYIQYGFYEGRIAI